MDHGVKTYHGTIHGINLNSIMYHPLEYLYYQRPLATRAWCYQEQRLARRVLHIMR